MKYTIESDYMGDLTDKEAKVLAFVTLNPRYSEKRHYREAARILNMLHSTYVTIIEKPKVQERIKFETMLPTLILAETKSLAANTLRLLLKNSKNDHVKLNAAALILKKELNDENNDVDDDVLEFKDWEEDKKDSDNVV